MPTTYDSISAFLQAHQVTLVAVSKTKPDADILTLYAKGQRDFGENRVQELREKYERLPKDIRWHMIGHLQSNKVKYIAPWIYMIHSIDTLNLLEEVNKQAEKYKRVIPCLLQLHIAQEETKFGFDTQEIDALFAEDPEMRFPHVRIHGLMAMATNTDDAEIVKKECAQAKALFDRLQKTIFADKNYFNTLSMGMSSDFEIAVAAGSTLVRIGSLLFGERH